MRRGGATTLAEHGSLAAYIIQKFGRWSSDMWMEIYQELTERSAQLLSAAFRPSAG